MRKSTKPPKTRNWKAWVDTMPGSPPTLYVTGGVEVMPAYSVPYLAIPEPPGINPQILLLDLKIESSGKPGIQIIEFKKVEYTDTPLGAEVVTDVKVLWEDRAIATVKVEKVEIRASI